MTENAPTEIEYLLDYLDFYGEQTSGQIEWREDVHIGKKFVTEAALGAALLDVQHSQITESEPKDFLEQANHILSKFYREDPVQVAILTTNMTKELPWLSEGENSPYILEGSIEDYESDIVIYRKDDEYRASEMNSTGLKKATFLGSIPQHYPLNGLIKGLEDSTKYD